MNEAKLKELEEKFELEGQEIEQALKDIQAKIEENKDDPTIEGLRLLESLLKDETLLVDTILGTLQGQPTNKVNLKFMLARNEILLKHFEYGMDDCTDFTNSHPPSTDDSMYFDSEMKHVLKKFLVYLYTKKDMIEVKPKLDDGEEMIKT